MLILIYTASKAWGSPLTRGALTYTYIREHPSIEKMGSFFDFLAILEREDEDSPWAFMNVSLYLQFPSFPRTALNFQSTFFENLDLTFYRKFFLTDIELGKVHFEYHTQTWLKYFNGNPSLSEADPITGFKVYALYQFRTIRHGVPLTITIPLDKENYHEKDKYPRNWTSMYIKIGHD